MPLKLRDALRDRTGSEEVFFRNELDTIADRIIHLKNDIKKHKQSEKELKISERTAKKEAAVLRHDLLSQR